MENYGRFGNVEKRWRKNIRQMMINGEKPAGLGISIASPDIAEIAAAAGYDFVWIDMEHNLFNPETIQSIVRVCDSVGMAALARITDYSMITALLDFGITSFTFPHVRTKEQAEEIVRAVRYAPIGRRGYTGDGRAQRYGLMDMKQYIKEYEEEIFISILIEDAEGIDNYKEIFAVEGIDAASIGEGDLAEALGYPGEPDHPLVLEWTEKIMSYAHEHGIMDEPAIISVDKVVLRDAFMERLKNYRAEKQKAEA